MTITSILPVIWLTVILAAIFTEAASEKLVAVWLAPSAAAAFICGLFKMSPWEQFILFALLSVSFITASKAVCAAVKRRGKHNEGDGDIE